MSRLLSGFLPAVLLVGTGFACRVLGIFTKEDGKALSKLVLTITLPATAFRVLSEAALSSEALFLLPTAALVAPLLLLGPSYLLARQFELERKVRGVFLCSATVANLGFFLYPLFLELYGSEGLARLVVFDIGNTIFAYSATLAIARFYGTGGENTVWANLRSMIKSPPLWGASLGLVANRWSMVPPGPIAEILEIAGTANLFLVMLALGIFIEPHLSRVKILLAGVFVRMGLGLAVGVALAALFALSGLDRIVVTMATGMPVGMTVLIYAANEGLDTEFAAALVSVSLIVGLVSVALLTTLLPPPRFTNILYALLWTNCQYCSR